MLEAVSSDIFPLNHSEAICRTGEERDAKQSQRVCKRSKIYQNIQMLPLHVFP